VFSSPAGDRFAVGLTQGRPLYGVDMKIADEQGTRCRTTARAPATCS
jgi:hypothetical protein